MIIQNNELIYENKLNNLELKRLNYNQQFYKINCLKINNLLK